LAHLQTTSPDGLSVDPLSGIDGLEQAAAWAQQAAALVLDASTVVLDGPGDLDDAIALAQIEAALLDLGRPYRRRLTRPRRFLDAPPGLSVEPEPGACVVAVRDGPDAHPTTQTPTDSLVMLVPVTASVSLGRDGTARHGALTPSVSAAMLAEHLAPTGHRVRRVRALALVAQWRRGALDAAFDPMYTVLRDHCAGDGTIRVVSLAETDAVPNHLPPGLQRALLGRLRRSWSRLDLEARARGMSEVVLPSLLEPGTATARLEELVWHRPSVPGQSHDLLDQATSADLDLPGDEDEAMVSMSRRMDLMLREGLLHVDA